MADKEEIRERSNILDVAGACVSLKQRGRNYVGLCPFHQEKSPSFNVDPITQTFTCFGCGASGDVFTFVMKYENMEFVEAAEFLARRVGLELDRKGGGTDAQTRSERDQLFEANSAALSYFKKTLERAPAAKSYLAGRGLAPETIARFHVGYALDSWDGLASYLRSQRIDLQIAQTAGLLGRGKTGEFYDVFRNRILFPIHDEQERVVGFGGRAMGDEQPKYLNTGETPLFSKSKLLYGLPYARRKIASAEMTLLMEGYTDVIAAHQAGFTNAVATLGTSLTEEHARKLARLARVVVLVYDGDNAGIKATLRASEILEREEVEVRVIALPPGDDPDSLLKRGETAIFQRAIDAAPGRVEYQLQRIVARADEMDEAGRSKMLTQIVHILATVPTRLARDPYIDKMWRFHPMSAKNPGLATEQLHKEVEAYAARMRRAAKRKAEQAAGSAVPEPKPVAVPTATDDYIRPQRDYPKKEDGGLRRNDERGKRFEQPRYIDPPPYDPTAMTAEQRAERELIRALSHPDWFAKTYARLDPADFVSPLMRQFYEFVGNRLSELNADPFPLVNLLHREADTRFSLSILQLLQEINSRLENQHVSRSTLDSLSQPSEAVIAGSIQTLRRHRQQVVEAELKQLLQSKTTLDAEDWERVEEYQRVLKALKGSSGSM